MGKQTPFYDLHLKAHAKMVDFAGWDMPLHYGSQIEEHHQVRRSVGMFDVSHMGVVDLIGEEAEAFLRFLLANDVGKLTTHQALYTCMLNKQGGILDDLIVYKLSHDKPSDHFFRLIVNAGTREKDLRWIEQQAQPFAVNVTLRQDLCLLAVQGPEAQAKMEQVFPEISTLKTLSPFHCLTTDALFIARTGYTGEDGFEIILPVSMAEKIWGALLAQHVIPCGLGARDTLRLEAGLNLYGNDMDETVTPYESNLAWTVHLKDTTRDFIGRESLSTQIAAGPTQRLVGLVLIGPGIIRHHQKVLINNDGIGTVTSGGYSPTLNKSIALARIPAIANEKEATCFVEIRQKQIPAQIVKPPFVRREKTIGD